MAVVRMDHPPGNGLVGPSPEATPSRPPPLAQVDGVVFPFLGGFGRYQKRLVLLSWLPVLLVSCNQFSDYIHLAQPNITCTGNVTGAAETVAVPPLNGSTRTPFLTDSYEDNGMQCSCSERQIQLEFGLKQNVITEVRMRHYRGCYPWSSRGPVMGESCSESRPVGFAAGLHQSSGFSKTKSEPSISYMCKQEQDLGEG